MSLALLSASVLLATGCAFYEKNYVSRIVLEGKNYRPAIYDEGVFYINDEPAIRMRVGCYASTQLGATMFPLIPLPIFVEAEPHASIAAEQFSLVLSHSDNLDIDLSELVINLELAGRDLSLRLARDEIPEYQYKRKYTYVAELPCGEIEDGVLRIRLSPDKVRVYGMHFKEGVEREFAIHSTFVT